MLVKKTIPGAVILVASIGIASFLLLSPQFLTPAFGSQEEATIGSGKGPKTDSPQRKAFSKKTVNKTLVTVVNAHTQTQQAVITGYGEVAARWTTALTAEVSGQIDHVSTKLLAGSSFNKGDVLAQINTIDYDSELAEAKANVAAAQVTYLEQQRETQQAKKRWELSGLSGTPSALTLQTPQLNQALASLQSAKAALAKAKKNVARTQIVAPFNGRVSSRNVNLGGYVTAGTVLAEVFATDIVEVNIALTNQQFALLGSEDDAVNRAVTLVDTSGGTAYNASVSGGDSGGVTENSSTRAWTAKIARFQYHINRAERTRNVVLEVNSAQAAEYLLPGTFVKAAIPGQLTDNLIKLPASALSREGYIWHVENGRLQRFKANIAYRQDDYLVIQRQNTENNLQVVRYPQSAFLPGQAVNAKNVAGPSVAPQGHQITNGPAESSAAGASI